MQDLKDVTQDVHYENFRAQCISQISQHAMRERGYVYFVNFVSAVDSLLIFKKPKFLVINKNDRTDISTSPIYS